MWSRMFDPPIFPPTPLRNEVKVLRELAKQQDTRLKAIRECAHEAVLALLDHDLSTLRALLDRITEIAANETTETPSHRGN